MLYYQLISESLHFFTIYREHQFVGNAVITIVLWQITKPDLPDN